MSDALEFLIAPTTAEARSRLVFGLVTARVRRIGEHGEYFLAYLSMGDEDQESAPARVMVPMAGAGRGMHFLPEVDDEVVVAFGHGDTNNPIILGAVWNNASPPPDQARQGVDNDVRTIVSRSGHELTFDDTDQQEKVLLKSKSGHRVLLDDTHGKGKIEIRTAGGRRLVLDDTPTGTIELSDGAGCTLKIATAGSQVTIESSLMLTLKAQILSLEATSISLKTSGAVSTSMVSIDGKPFGLHQHLASPTSPSGPVMP